MTVIAFPELRRGACWQEQELQMLMQVFARHAASGEASDWKVGTTENAEPQFYVLGPEPASECILSVSRVRRTYVLENGGGAVLAEGSSLREISERAARATFEAKRASIIARMLVLWCIVRQTVEEKVEPLLAEPAEALSHFMPQFAALV